MTMMSRPSTKSASEPLDAQAARNRALALLTRREHSVAELKAKLVGHGASVDLAGEVIAALADSGLQSDERFAASYVRSRAQRGFGPVVIGQELRQRGISPEQVADVLHNGEFDWCAEARDVRRKRFRGDLPQDRREQARQLRFLLYRGFSNDQARSALRVADDE